MKTAEEFLKELKPKINKNGSEFKSICILLNTFAQIIKGFGDEKHLEEIKHLRILLENRDAYISTLEKKLEPTNKTWDDILTDFVVDHEQIKPYTLLQKWLEKNYNHLLLSPPKVVKPLDGWVSLEELFEKHQEFCKHKFPKSTHESSLRGLEREIKEVELAQADYQVIDGKETRNNLGLEYVDCFMYLLDSMKRAGFSVEELKFYFIEKAKINDNRDWKINKDGSYSHIKLPPAPLNNIKEGESNGSN